MIQHVFGPKQNRVERRPQLVAERGKKAVFRRACVFGIFFCLREFLFDTASLDEKTDLAAQSRDQLQQIGIRLEHIFTEQFNDAVDRAAREKWKGETGVQPCFARGGKTRKVLIYGDV